MWLLSPWKTASLSGNNIWIMGMHLITQPVHIFPCSNLAVKGNSGTNRMPRYYWPDHHSTLPVFHYRNRAFWRIECAPNVNSSWCRNSVKDDRLIWIYHAFPEYSVLLAPVLHYCEFSKQWFSVHGDLSLSVSVNFFPLFPIADIIFPWFVYGAITLGTVAHDAPDNLTVFVTDAPAKRESTICRLSKSE